MMIIGNMDNAYYFLRGNQKIQNNSKHSATNFKYQHQIVVIKWQTY